MGQEARDAFVTPSNLGDAQGHRRHMALVAGGDVRRVVGMVRPLDEVNGVFEALEGGKVAGRAVLDVVGSRRAS
jgi:D-arabinose 1-dehydrogenase-like Zn-dependent alcohol dehydrogenase